MLKQYTDTENLRRLLSIPDKNFSAAVVLYLGVAISTSVIVYLESSHFIALVWLACAVLVWISSIVLYLSKRPQLLLNPARHARWANATVFVNSLAFAVLVAVVVPHASLAIAVFFLCVCIVIAIGIAAFGSPYLPLFFVMTYPIGVSLLASLLLRNDTLSLWLGFTTFLSLVLLTWFAMSLSASILNMMTTNDENEGLANRLRSALVQTDEANRAKSVFLASASHDLRQPLHALGLLNETMGGTELDTTQQEIHQHMSAALESTQSMLDALLNISKLDAGAISAKPKPFYVQTLFQKLEDELAPTADENNLIYRTRETIAAAYSDPFIVELILRNLIANAIRYTKNGGLLVACRARSDAQLSIEVWDTGIGIPPDMLDELFREFRQLDNPERDSKKGFGLGLAIAQGLAATLDSKIEVASKLNHGSVFRFLLPRSTADVIEDIPQRDSHTDFSGTKVLVIDDDHRVLSAMQQLLNTWGCDCLCGESAQQVIKAADLSDYPIHAADLALVDYRLRDGATGREAIAELRQHLREDLPAIIITGDTGADRIAEAKSVDALLLHKPASARQLRSMMRSLLATA